MRQPNETIARTTRTRHMKANLYARVAGWLYLFIIVVGFWDEMVVRGKIIVPANAAATAHNLAANETLWRIGFAGEITMWLFSIAIMAIFYVLLRPVNATIALMALLFNVMDTAVETTSAVLCNFSALFFASGRSYLHAFDSGQLQALTSLVLRLHEYGFAAGLLFFGVFLILLGSLMVRSGYFPQWLGILAAIGGACYVMNSYSVFAAPALEDRVFPFILLPALIAELSISIWLIVKGVDEAKFVRVLQQTAQV